jgi:hypothetical protein
MISSFGLTCFFVLKFCIILSLIAAMVLFAYRSQGTKTHRYVGWGLWFLCAVYLYVVLCNLQAIL